MQSKNAKRITPVEHGSAYVLSINSAKKAQLHHVNKYDKGYTREKIGKSFVYYDEDGVRIKDVEELTRIKSLVIPPAWNKVWICPDRKGHLQATGIDSKGRKQYRYHSKWRLKRDEIKFDHMLDFALQLPDIRSNVNKALLEKQISRKKIIAIVIYLLEKTLIRIGNDAYALENNSFGLTTMRNRHVGVAGSDIKFNFRGKSGIKHEIKIHDKRLSRIIWKLKDIPGQNLFQYIDEANSIHTISSSDVNEYLKEITGNEHTAKDFRTWYGTFYTALTLSSYPPFETQSEAKRNLSEAIKFASKKLGNTESICKKCYVHPIIIDEYISGNLFDLAKSRKEISSQEETYRHVENYILNKLKANLI